jgi:hypothetical protein
MSLSYVGPKGSFEERWIVFALLRDNVQHHIEGGTRTEAFGAVYSISEALGGGQVKIDARALNEQVTRAKVLLARPVDDLAISLLTKTAIHLLWPPRGEHETALVKDTMDSVPGVQRDARTLHDVFGDFVEQLLSITDGAAAGEVVEVIDM